MGPGKNRDSKEERKQKQPRGNSNIKARSKPSTKPKKLTSLKEAPQAETKAPVITSNGKKIFSKFDLGLGEHDKRKRKHASFLSNPKQALEKLQAQQERMNQLAAQNPDKAFEKQQSLEWSKAMALAKGEKVKDDPKLLKRALKRKQQQKNKSSKEWSERLEKDKKTQKLAAQKKVENIAARKKRPGFEGKGFGKKT